MEIERKYLLNQLPDIPPLEETEIYQGYLSTSPEIRVRSYRVVSGKNVGHKDYKLTVKGNGDLAREEIETYISEEFFNRIVMFIGKPLIHKRYLKYQYEGYLLECSIVDEGSDHSFIYGEVEFDSMEQAYSYRWPFKGAKDITFYPDYKMKNYWDSHYGGACEEL